MSHLTLDEIRQKDAADSLRGFRGRFALPEGLIYLDGNSLGALPKVTATRVAETVSAEWGQGLIRSWNAADWIRAPQRIGAKIAKLVGAKPNEVIVADSTSVNLFKLLCAGLSAQGNRRTILSEPGNFPTDLYVAEGVAGLHPGVRLKTVAREDIAGAIDDDTAVVMLTHVHYKTGERFDMAAMAAAAQAKGALILFDLSHSAGAMQVDLNAAHVDLAIGCGYKYLNGGPGAPAFLYVAERHQAKLSSPLSGWMGHAAPFAFDDGYQPAPGLARFLCGTPPILAMTALEAGIDLFLEADMATVEEKSRALCSLFIELVEGHCAGFGLELATPREPARRGSQVSFAHPEGYAIMQALIASGVIGDFRAPDILRFGFTPLYTRYEDAWNAVEILRGILATRGWDKPEFKVRQAVT